MPIPDLERKRVEDLLVKFCDRIPAHLRPKLTNGFVFKGNAVELFEGGHEFADLLAEVRRDPTNIFFG